MLRVNEIHEKIHDILDPHGFECYPFKVGWYNEHVQPVFRFDLPYDTVAFVIISTPHMFDLALKPFIVRSHCVGVKDPVDQCIDQYFNEIQQSFGDADDLLTIHDYELDSRRRPRVLVQTAAHVAGAAFYYRRTCLTHDPWNKSKCIFGVSVHPKFGGWFAMRGIVIVRSLQVAALPRVAPVDVCPTDADKVELLRRFNVDWRDATFRDIIPVTARYSSEQLAYFSTAPRDRATLINRIKNAGIGVEPALAVQPAVT